MGARQSRRSVDITTTPKKEGLPADGGVGDAAAPGDGKLERIEETDTKPTTNGIAPHTDVPEDKDKDKDDATEKEKDKEQVCFVFLLPLFFSSNKFSFSISFCSPMTSFLEIIESSIDPRVLFFFLFSIFPRNVIYSSIIKSD